MLTLLIGEDWVTNRNSVIDLIAQDVRDKKNRRILIVPELISHDTEVRLCAAAGDTASRFSQVLSFTRLVRRVADSVGCAAEDCLDNGGRIVAMAAAARQLHSKLKAYAAVETKPEFLTGLLDAIDEFKRCCITASDLSFAAKNTQGSLAQKLEELALLMDCYDGICSRGKKDPRDQMTWLLSELESSDFASENVFYIDGFPDFTRQHMAILQHLICKSPSVTVSLNCDRLDSGKIAFEKAGETAGELIRFAKRLNVPFVVKTIMQRQDHLQPIRTKLFQGELVPQEKIPELTSFTAETLYQECTAAAQRINDLIRNGARYKDISVVVSDLAAYGKTVEMVFDRCRIPCYIAGTESILDRSVIRAILVAMNTAFNGFEQQDTLQYLKSILSPLDFSMCDRIENYAFLWRIDRNDWLQDWTKNPEGLNAQSTQATDMYLEQLNTARKQALDPLIELRDRFRSATNMAEQVTALYAFIERINLAKCLESLASDFDSKGDNRTAQILNQLWDILLTALEQLHDMLGDTVWDTDAFMQIFTLLLSQYDVGTIPHVLDAVTVGPVSAMRCQEAKHLIVLGAQEGKMPGYSGSVGVLSDQERKILRNIGVPLTGGSLDGLQAEFSEIYGVFCGASETVTVSCSGGEPSFVFRRLLAMSGGTLSMDTNIGTAFADCMDAGAYLSRWNAKDIACDLGIEEEYEQFVQKRDHLLGDLSLENVKKLYGEQLRLSASQIDKQADCRMSYFLRYGLHAKERKPAAIDPAEFGTFVHAVLENTAKDVTMLGGFKAVSLDETVKIAEKHATQYANACFSQVDTERLHYLFRRNGQELDLIVRELWSELQNSDFEPVGFEVGFGDGEQMPPIVINGEHMQAILRGFVDRVDVWNAGTFNAFRVVDYKTGRKDFDYCDVYNGLGLQMLLYLFVLAQEGHSLIGNNPVMAGVQYFPARAPIVSADSLLSDADAAIAREKEWKRKGLISSDEDVLHAMQINENVNRMPYTRRKDGTLSGDLANEQQFILLQKYVYRILQNMVDEIASGSIAPNPYTRGSSHNACTYCPYDSVCHLETVTGRRDFKAITAQRFWEDIEKEVCGNG